MTTAGTNNGKHGGRPKVRIGLQLKTVLAISSIVVAVTAGGGWMYFDAARSAIRGNDYRHAAWMGQSLVLATQQDFLERAAASKDTSEAPSLSVDKRDRKATTLQGLAGDFIRNGNVLYVSVLDENGNILACASRDGGQHDWSSQTSFPVALSNMIQASDNTLVFATPVVLGKSANGQSALAGAVRLVLDTSTTTETLVNVQRRVQVIAAIMILCALPLGYLAAWWLAIQPIRRLLVVTQELAHGKMNSRSRIKRNDEMGVLSAALDAMADEVSCSRDELLQANERLEKKVAQRTEEIQRVNCRLRDEMAEREDFLRAVSHDLNAPLRNIAGMTAMILAKYRGVLPEEAIGRLDRITANVDTETSLITDLLELSRIKTQPQKRQVVDMGELLTGVAQSFEYELKSRNIELAISRPMPRLYVEKNRVYQVFQNLIDNAIKYMDRRRDGRIEVDYQFVDGAHQFSVKDNGPGIPPDEHNKIFYVFRRAESAAASKIEGKGVGLAVVKSIVTNYEGNVWVVSEPQEGATFFATFGQGCTQPPDEADERADIEDLDGELTSRADPILSVDDSVCRGQGYKPGPLLE